MADVTSTGELPRELSADEKDVIDSVHVETIADNLVYTEEDEEPELHARTYIAITAMFLLNYVLVLALQGPPAVVSHND